MKRPIIIAAFLSAILFFSFINKPEVADCYLSFNEASDLKRAQPERFPEENDHIRKLTTIKGDAEITIVNGYRILYLNKKEVPFVNVKVELSSPQHYETDKQNVLDNFKFLNGSSAGMETKELIELNYNGYKIYGLSRNNIDTGSILSTFVMFPGNNTIVYFYFNNLKPGFRNFNSLDDYKGQRNNFIGGYTSHIRSCN